MLQKTDTALAAAFGKAGMNVAASRLRGIAHDAMKKHHGNVERALTTFEKDVGGDRELIREALRSYLMELPVEGQRSVDAHSSNANGRQPQADGGGNKPLEPPATVAPPIREPSAAQTAADLAVRTRAAINVFDRELTRTGQRWGNVCYSELHNMTEDGEIARAIRRHIGSMRGAEALKPIRELMTPREFAILINKTRKGSK